MPREEEKINALNKSLPLCVCVCVCVCVCACARARSLAEGGISFV